MKCPGRVGGREEDIRTSDRACMESGGIDAEGRRRRSPPLGTTATNRSGSFLRTRLEIPTHGSLMRRLLALRCDLPAFAARQRGERPGGPAKRRQSLTSPHFLSTLPPSPL